MTTSQNDGASPRTVPLAQRMRLVGQHRALAGAPVSAHGRAEVE
jgi:hypothetical protein